jgi:hypothetical protein
MGAVEFFPSLEKTIHDRPCLAIMDFRSYIVTWDEVFRMLDSGRLVWTVNLKGVLDQYQVDSKQELSMSEVAEIAGVSYFVMYDWVKKGVLKPSIREAGGSGRFGDRTAIFSWFDGFIVKVIGVMRRSKANFKVISAAVEGLRHLCLEAD